MMRCAQCGEEHPLETLELTFRRPDAIAALSAERRALEVRESDDLCEMKEGRWFARGVLPLPVHERDHPYHIGLWVEVDESSFHRIRELWDDPDQADEPAMPATIANAIPTLPATLGLAAALRLTGPKTRPDVFVADDAHPLFTEQAAGIPFHRAFEYTATVRGGGRAH
jgi:hypothetical protein